MTEAPLLTIVVPVFNESQTIGEVLSRLSKLTGIRKEIIVVDDGSTDNTGEILKRYPNVRVARHSVNRGKGAALRTGLALANGDMFIVQDADLEYSPEDIPAIVRPIIVGRADVVYASRFRGNCLGMSFSHRLGNLILSALTSFLFLRRVTDVMTGYKAFARNALPPGVLEEDRFDVEIGVTAGILRRRELRYQEVPISYAYRRKGRSKIQLRDGLICFLKLLKLRMTVRRSHELVRPWRNSAAGLQSALKDFSARR